MARSNLLVSTMLCMCKQSEYHFLEVILSHQYIMDCSYTFTTPTDGYNRAYRQDPNGFFATFLYYIYTEKICTVSTVNLLECQNNSNKTIENHALRVISWPVYIQVPLCREGGMVPCSCRQFI